MKTKFVNFLKEMRSSLDDDASAVAVAVQELIKELEQSEDLFTEEQIVEKIKAILPTALDDTEVQNKIKVLFNKFNIENKTKTMVVDKKTEYRNKIASAMVNSKKGVDFQNAINGMPAAVEIFGEIQTPWNVESGLFGAIRKIGSVNTTIPYTADDDADTFAFGHVNGAKKNDQDFDVSPKNLVNQMIYKQLPINRADIYNYSQSRADRTAFIDWVLQELPERLYSTIERVIVTGNAWQTTTANKITSFEGIGSKTAADAFTLFKTFSGAYSTDAHRNTILGDLSELSISINNKNKEKWLYINPKLLAFLMKRLYASGGNYHFVGYDALAAELGVNKIIPYSYLGDGGTAGDALAVIITPELYYRAGGEMFGEQWTAYEYNAEYYRAEIFASGAIGGLASTAVYKRATA